MNAASAINVRLLFVAHLISLLQYSSAGTCWSAMVRNGNGRCTELLQQKISKEDCCSGRSVTTSWSAEELDSGTLFFWRILGGGVRCSSCRDSCKGVTCEVGKTCVLRKGTPKCVCASKCKVGKSRRKTPVCGTDGRSYRNICRLRKMSCRRKSHSLAVAYKGTCQTHATCTKVRCRQDQSCLKDSKTGMPRCASCSESCLPRNAMRGPICASNNSTYYSWCHMMQDACRQGYVIDTKHAGRCKMTSPKLTKI
nr:follistatin-like [Leptinotarsa decemlineata]